MNRRLDALERRGHSSGTYHTPEQEAERERRFDDLWKQLYEEYGVERGEPIKSRRDAVGELWALVAKHRREAG
jgi:hypothetical protein